MNHSNIKTIIRSITPPIIIRVCQNLVYLLRWNEDFKAWWKKFSSDENLPSDLKLMVDYFITTPSFKSSSKYWHYLNRKNIQQLLDYGYENFKQTIARNYFLWREDSKSLYVRDLLNKIDGVSINLPVKEVQRKHMFFTREESILYNQNTVLLLNYVEKIGEGRYINILEETLEGNPPFLIYKGKRVTQDILNSILEYRSLVKGCNLSKISSILELGAGSGRTASCLLKLLSNVKYVVVDIPPALYISQTYLSNIFNDRKIFSFRSFESFKKIEEEFKEADIVFLMPDQLYLLPDKSIDLFLAINCLHEMKKEQVESYFSSVDRLAKYFYFKAWQKSVVPFDNIVHSSENYPVRQNWNQVYKRACEVPVTYFEAFYEIKN